MAAGEHPLHTQHSYDDLPLLPPCLPPRPKPTPLPHFVSRPSQIDAGCPPQETCSASDLQLPRPNPQEPMWSGVGGRDGFPSSLPTAPPHLLWNSIWILPPTVCQWRARVNGEGFHAALQLCRAILPGLWHPPKLAGSSRHLPRCAQGDCST
ncbi:hypothetical protein GQ607_001865 [Colletotrichum asianum]|uniref:Uncharacterized protein n=1 Tax=Colletotrichum asianum TaxID=702518 RepID=A0A8H3WS24_9PEZI|nr:hypothetical protein GQ607_001865 [Colletotrichum asianum]